jgi:hypothetical protein
LKTYTERRIEMGQDVNNAWSLVVAGLGSGDFSEERVRFLWSVAFPLVRELSVVAREVDDGK